MLYPLIVTALSPLLLAQGLYVRKITPRLPEAFGERSGQSGLGTPLHLLILGDSAAAGVGVQLQKQALSGQLSAMLALKHQTSWRLWAKNGYKSLDLLELLEAKPPEKLDVVLISIGVNDVTGGTSHKNWLSVQQKIFTLLFEKFSAQQIIFTALPPMHFFPALPQPLRWVFGLRANQFNRSIQALINSTPHCSFLAFNTPMKAEFMAEDGFHPSAKTYTLWAQEAAKRIKINRQTA
jgi:lysophospholipase L1-like esterase